VPRLPGERQRGIFGSERKSPPGHFALARSTSHRTRGAGGEQRVDVLIAKAAIEMIVALAQHDEHVDAPSRDRIRREAFECACPRQAQSLGTVRRATTDANRR